MQTRAPRRHAVLFLFVLVLPCLVLVALGVRMIAEGEELAIARQADAARRELEQIGGELTARLERLKLEEAGRLASGPPAAGIAPPAHPDVALVGWIREGRLLLPWDVDPARARFTAMLTGTPFAEAIAQGEREEAAAQLTQAQASLRRAVTLAPDREWADYPNLLLARVFVKCRCPEDAQPLYQALLASRLVDDHGVPIALYAAKQLLTLGARWTSVVLDGLDERPVTPWTSPPAAYLSRDLLTTLKAAAPTAADRRRADALLSRVADRLAAIERALRLQRDWQGLESVAATRGPDPVWVSYDGGVWLVSTAPSLAGLPPLVIALGARAVLDAAGAATPGRAALAFSTTGTAGEPVGPSFPGLRVSVASTEAEGAIHAWTTQRTYYIVALVAVIGVALLGGTFFWWDVRRELRMAELRSEFVASVSHELRTPITAIRMFAETLQMERPLGAAARAEYLATIVNESERLTRLVNNVLDFSRIERGDKVYTFEPVSLSRIVENAARAMQYPLSRQGFALTVDVDDDVPPVRGDQDAVEQAVLNLLSNAVKYSGDRRAIDLTVARVNGHVVIAVRDEGVGIAPAEQAKIFGRFYRVPTPENGRIPGAGLGLALVDHIVKAHGGHVEVTSAPGQGSTFAIHLPVEAPA